MKIFLYPFSWLYWIVTYIRNKFFDWGIFRSKSYNKPVIAVGNLSVGGTGKTPFVIYLIELFKDKNLIGIVSRGYGRVSKGYHFANYDANFEDIGDEPMQFFERFRNSIVVGVHEKRTQGINTLIKDFDPDVFILDDAFQHRYVKAGLYILLTDYNNLYCNDYVLPLGRLREGRYGAKRAKIIIVTKCSKNLSREEMEQIKGKLKLQPYQLLFFSKIVYEKEIVSYSFRQNIDEVADYHILLITGIAKYTDILDFTNEKFSSVTHLNFKDHHSFSETDIEKIEKSYQELPKKKLILTTEKDYMRLKHYQQLKNDLFYLPISVELNKPEEFKKVIYSFIKK